MLQMNGQKMFVDVYGSFKFTKSSVSMSNESTTVYQDVYYIVCCPLLLMYDTSHYILVCRIQK